MYSDIVHEEYHPITHELNAFGVEEVDLKLGEEPMLESSVTFIAWGYSYMVQEYDSCHISSAFPDDNDSDI